MQIMKQASQILSAHMQGVDEYASELVRTKRAENVASRERARFNCTTGFVLDRPSFALLLAQAVTQCGRKTAMEQIGCTSHNNIIASRLAQRGLTVTREPCWVMLSPSTILRAACKRCVAVWLHLARRRKLSSTLALICSPQSSLSVHRVDLTVVVSRANMKNARQTR